MTVSQCPSKTQLSACLENGNSSVAHMAINFQALFLHTMPMNVLPNYVAAEARDRR